jgi:hypothetical protein
MGMPTRWPDPASGYSPSSEAALLRRAARCTVEEIARLIEFVEFLAWQWEFGTDGKTSIEDVQKEFSALKTQITELEAKVSELTKTKETE